ncbi:MAG: serine/threonine protein kinase [Candidatus Obscuribacterales bacterium]|nr:serine/threonine protein kinase [Candidatus Obscuribacterales bacterium]
MTDSGSSHEIVKANDVKTKSIIELRNKKKTVDALPSDFQAHAYKIFYSESQSQKTQSMVTYSINVALLFLLVTTYIAGRHHGVDWLKVFGATLIVTITLVAINVYLNSLMSYWFELSPKSIKFSHGWGPDLLYRLERRWDEIYSIEMIEVDPSISTDMATKARGLEQVIWSKDATLNTRNSIRFHFKSGGAAMIWLGRLNRLQLKCLFLAIESWLDPSKLSREVVNAKNMLLTECGGDGSYTEIWMQDLECKFSTTSFLPLIPGTALQDGGYRITTELSTRGQSAVYLASDRKGGEVVIKELCAPHDPDDKLGQKLREMFHREMRILLKLQHKNLATVLDYFFENDRDYIVLEHRPGLNMRQRYKLGQKLEEKEIVQITNQMLEVARYLHSQEPPIVHRDLTPDNIILQPDGQIAIVDFGAANEYLSGVTSTLVGKQSYMPIEQIRGKACPQSDVFAIGATAFFLLTGEDPVPLEESNPRSMNESVSIALDDFVSRCMKLELTERYQSCAEALNAMSCIYSC